MTSLTVDWHDDPPREVCASPLSVLFSSQHSLTISTPSKRRPVQRRRSSSSSLYGVSCCQLPSVEFCLTLSASARTDLALAFFCDGEAFPHPAQSPPLGGRHLFFALLQPPFIVTRLAQVKRMGCSSFFCHNSRNLEECEDFSALVITHAQGPAGLPKQTAVRRIQSARASPHLSPCVSSFFAFCHFTTCDSAHVKNEGNY